MPPPRTSDENDAATANERQKLSDAAARGPPPPRDNSLKTLAPPPRMAWNAASALQPPSREATNAAAAGPPPPMAWNPAAAAPRREEPRAAEQPPADDAMEASATPEAKPAEAEPAEPAAPAAPAPAPESHKVAFTATLSALTLAEFDADARDEFGAGLARGLGVAPSAVAVDAARAGSVVVDGLSKIDVVSGVMMQSPGVPSVRQRPVSVVSAVLRPVVSHQ